MKGQALWRVWPNLGWSRGGLWSRKSGESMGMGRERSNYLVVLTASGAIHLRWVHTLEPVEMYMWFWEVLGHHVSMRQDHQIIYQEKGIDFD